MCRLWPAGSVPSAHGNGVVQAPVLLTNVSPAGVGSVTVTSVASSVPMLLAVMEYTRFVPGVTLAGPAFVISTLIVNSGPTAVRGRRRIVGEIGIGRRTAHRCRVHDGIRSRIARRDQELRLNDAALTGGNRPQGAGEHRRAGAGIADERQPHRRRIRDRHGRGIARPVVRDHDRRRPGWRPGRAAAAGSSRSRGRLARARAACWSSPCCSAEVRIGRRAAHRRGVHDRTRRGVARRHGERRDDSDALAHRQRPQCARKRRRARARVAHEGEAGRRRVGYADARRLVRPVVRDGQRVGDASSPASRSTARSC